MACSKINTCYIIKVVIERYLVNSTGGMKLKKHDFMGFIEEAVPKGNTPTETQRNRVFVLLIMNNL